ncbi:MAG: RNA polymerase sporulation sigma factor SigH [Lentisphaerae bacterium]|nr:RNA polymerase sporulation sigma factor SigH [Lentisphaerota bacterium]
MHRSDSTDRNWQTFALRDEELVSRAKAGRESAIDELFRRYRSLVESKARLYYLAGADQEDVIQEGMIGLFKAVRDYSYQRARAFRSFADLCVTRQIITAVKAASRQKHSALNSYVSMDAPTTTRDQDQCLADILAERREPNPEQVVLGRQLYEEVSWRVTSELSDLEGQALSLYLQGRSYSEIAGNLECNVKQIDNALQRAKRKITRDIWPDVPVGRVSRRSVASGAMAKPT